MIKRIVLLLALMPTLALASFSIEQENYTLHFDTKDMVLSLYKDNHLVYQTNRSRKDKLHSFAIRKDDGRWMKKLKYDSHQINDNTASIKLLSKKKQPVWINLDLKEKYVRLSIKTKSNTKEIRVNSKISTSGHWYGEGETVSRIGVVPILRGKMQQYWPLSSGEMRRKKFGTTDNSSVLVPLWFASKGVGIFVDSYHFLNESFNINKNDIFSLGMIYNKYTRPVNTTFTMDILVGENIKEIYQDWIDRSYTHKKAWNPHMDPPPYEMFEAPIWTTWAKYKSKISDKKVMDYANQIISSGLPYKILEIDDRWQSRYGNFEFDSKRFPSPKQTIEKLNNKGFEVTVWVPPFVNQSSSMYSVLESWGGMLTRKNGSVHKTAWWDTMYFIPNSGVFNFFDPGFHDWFIDLAQDFTSDYGILGIKYDAGETVYLNDKVESDFHPNSYCDHYIRDWRAKKAVEFRAATFSQHLTPIVREFDKNSTWDNYTGLKSVLTQALAMGIVGYPFVLPDMVGGNKYPFSDLSDELFIRWMQLNAFMPMIQLSLEPWSFNELAQRLTEKYLDVHQKLVPYIWQQVLTSMTTALPLVRPLFFEFPDYQPGYTVDDQFMLGDKFLIAPILEKKKYSRDIYLPPGEWYDFWSNRKFQGNQVIRNYPAPIETIPAFVKAI